MKLLQILELLTLIAEKVAFWKQAEKTESNKITKEKETNGATKNEENYTQEPSNEK